MEAKQDLSWVGPGWETRGPSIVITMAGSYPLNTGCFTLCPPGQVRLSGDAPPPSPGGPCRVEVHPPHPSWEQGPLTNDSREDALESFLAELGTHLSNMDDESPAWGGTGKVRVGVCPGLGLGGSAWLSRVQLGGRPGLEATFRIGMSKLRRAPLVWDLDGRPGKGACMEAKQGPVGLEPGGETGRVSQGLG